jgi:hypothetical protein
LHFENGLEYYAAVNAGCEWIATEDKSDFYFATISVAGAREFLEKHF